MTGDRKDGMETTGARAYGLRFVLTGAQTGGHLYPAVAVGKALVALGATVTLVTSGEGIESLVLEDVGLPAEVLRVGKLKGMGVLGWAKGIVTLPMAMVRASGLISRLRPDVVAGFGGFTSGPMVMAAAVRGIPTAICEENSVPGFTNRVLARFAVKAFTAFDETAAFLRARTVVRTGTPLRPEIVGVERKPAGGDERHVLVFGGSQGSAFLNRWIPETLAGAGRGLPGLHVLHQTGQGREAEVRAAYQRLGVDADVREYLHDMAGAYAWADMVVARSGAGTVSEVSAVGLPALFVPFAAAADNHQVANARPLVEAGAALMAEERDFDASRVAGELAGILHDPGKLAVMGDAARAWGRRDATGRLVGELLAMVRDRGRS